MNILNTILSDYVMVICWGGLVGFIVCTALRIKVYALFVLAGSAIPMFIFHLYGSLNIWGSVDQAHVYSRIAQVGLSVGLVVSLWLMRRSVFDGRNDLPHF